MKAVITRKEIIKLVHAGKKLYITSPSGEVLRVVVEGDKIVLHRELIMLVPALEVTADSLPMEAITIEEDVPIGGTVW
jgi:hypothetical protein